MLVLVFRCCLSKIFDTAFFLTLMKNRTGLCKDEYLSTSRKVAKSLIRNYETVTCVLFFSFFFFSFYMLCKQEFSNCMVIITSTQLYIFIPIFATITFFNMLLYVDRQ